MRRNESRFAGCFNHIPTCCGDDLHIEYQSVVNPDGSISLKVSGKTKIQEAINSHLDEVDMVSIVDRLRLGDTSMLRSSGVNYGDFTQTPSTMAEFLQLMHDADEAWSDVPRETKDKYDFDIKRWLAASGTKEWCENMGLIKSDKPTIPGDLHVEKPVNTVDKVVKSVEP